MSQNMNQFKGNSTHLRFVDEDGAEFIVNLRTDESLNKYLSVTGNSIEQQKQWIVQYKQREKAGSEYYFLICKNSDQSAIGTVRLYDFKEKKSSFCWGSWILNSNKTKTSAIESAMLVYEIGFNQLEFSSCRFQEDNDNQKVIDFHIKMGAKKVSENGKESYFIYSPIDYEQFREKFSKYLVKKDD